MDKEQEKELLAIGKEIYLVLKQFEEIDVTTRSILSTKLIPVIMKVKAQAISEFKEKLKERIEKDFPFSANKMSKIIEKTAQELTR